MAENLSTYPLCPNFSFSLFTKQKNPQSTWLSGVLCGCGGRIWTYDLRVMSPTSYRTAPLRDIKCFSLEHFMYYTIPFTECQLFFQKYFRKISLILNSSQNPDAFLCGNAFFHTKWWPPPPRFPHLLKFQFRMPCTDCCYCKHCDFHWQLQSCSRFPLLRGWFHRMVLLYRRKTMQIPYRMFYRSLSRNCRPVRRKPWRIAEKMRQTVLALWFLWFR